MDHPKRWVEKVDIERRFSIDKWCGSSVGVTWGQRRRRWPHVTSTLDKAIAIACGWTSLLVSLTLPYCPAPIPRTLPHSISLSAPTRDSAPRPDTGPSISLRSLGGVLWPISASDTISLQLRRKVKKHTTPICIKWPTGSRGIDRLTCHPE